MNIVRKFAIVVSIVAAALATAQLAATAATPSDTRIAGDLSLSRVAPHQSPQPVCVERRYVRTCFIVTVQGPDVNYMRASACVTKSTYTLSIDIKGPSFSRGSVLMRVPSGSCLVFKVIVKAHIKPGVYQATTWLHHGGSMTEIGAVSLRITA
jgi:hypothetical protein